MALQNLVQQRLRQPFAWGVHDCCLFAADWVLASTGTDPAADVRGQYCTARAAAGLLRRLGGLAAVGARAGQPVPPLMAQAGDVGLVRNAGRQLLAVCSGPNWVAPGALGLVVLPFDAACAAWRTQCPKQ